MNSDLLRQRRNLIAISVALLIFDFADVRIAKVNLLGTELLVGNAKVLMGFAWIVWLYFLLRYYQYWISESDQNIRNTFQRRLDKYARSYTKATPLRRGDGAIHNNYEIRRIGVSSWQYTMLPYDAVEGVHIVAHSLELPTFKLAYWCIKSAAYVCFQTKHVTDHALPFILALAAPVVTLFTSHLS